MKNTFMCADHHLGHRKIITFKNYDGTPLRDFEHIDDMHHTIITRHNSVVGDDDRVYMLGDVVISKVGFEVLRQLKGRKCLIKGNHDIFKAKQYLEYFDDIRAVVRKDGFVMTHVPIHPQSIERWGVNVHGHLHSNKVKLDPQVGSEYEITPTGEDDKRYLCVSLEQINYTPISVAEVLKRINNV